MPPAAKTVTRGVSPILFVLAAACFLLPFIGVSCNTAAGSAALGSLGTTGGSGDTSGAAASAACLQALNGHDLYVYSGVNLVAGSDPTVQTSIPGCPTSSSSNPSSPLALSPSAQAPTLGIGVQPLMIVVLVLILAGLISAAVRGRSGRIAGAAAAAGALVLVVVSNSAVHNAVVTKLDASANADGGSLSSVGLSGALDTFFNIHAALGFTLILVALALALLANLVAIVIGSGLRLTAAGAPGAPTAPPPFPPGHAPPPPPTG